MRMVIDYQQKQNGNMPLEVDKISKYAGSDNLDDVGWYDENSGTECLWSKRKCKCFWTV